MVNTRDKLENAEEESIRLARQRPLIWDVKMLAYEASYFMFATLLVTSGLY